MKRLTRVLFSGLILVPFQAFTTPGVAQEGPDWRAAMAASPNLDVLSAEGTFYHPMPAESRCLPYELKDARLVATEPYPVLLISALGVEFSHELVFEGRADRVFGLGRLESSMGIDEDLFVVTEASLDGIQLTSYPDAEEGSKWYLRDRVTCLVAMKDLAEGGKGNDEPQPERSRTDSSAQPTFTPYTVSPEITNRSEVSHAVEREYPAVNRDRRVPVWVAFPITFQVR